MAVVSFVVIVLTYNYGCRLHYSPIASPISYKIKFHNSMKFNSLLGIFLHKWKVNGKNM